MFSFPSVADIQLNSICGKSQILLQNGDEIEKKYTPMTGNESLTTFHKAGQYKINS